MNLNTQNARNIISKDNTLSKEAAQNIINNCDVESFSSLCENSSQIFDFIAQKVINNLLNATNKTNLNSAFEFAKCYDLIFGEYILKSWFKYADEDLTDKILELFENGSEAQKIYCAKYFKKINDPLALDYLNKYAFCDNEELSQACASTLAEFGDNTSKKISYEMLKSDDDFCKLKGATFLINYGCKDDICHIVKILNSTGFAANIAQEVLYKYTFDELLELLNEDDLTALYDEIISAYPEDVQLETVLDFNLEKFAQKLMTSKSSYHARLLADLKNTMELVNSDNIYTYDLGGEYLNAVKSLGKMLSKVNINTDIITHELEQGEKRILRALSTLSNLKSTPVVCEAITKLYKNTTSCLILCECARAAKALGISLDINLGLEKITDKNALELFKSYF